MKWGKKALVLSVAALFVLACVCSAEAQGRRGQGQRQQPGGPGGTPQGGPGGGPGGFGGPGMGMGGMGGMGFFGGGMNDATLLAREDVQKELELVDDQIEQLTKLGETIRNEMRESMRDVPREEMRDKMGPLMRDAQAKTKKALDEILLPHQAERLKQLVVQAQLQVGGLAQSEEVAKELEISDEQREHLRTKARELERALRKKLTEDLLKELKPEQQAKYKELVGEPFEFQQERGGPGRGGFGGFGGPGGGPGAPGPGAPGPGRRGN